MKKSRGFINRCTSKGAVIVGIVALGLLFFTAVCCDLADKGCTIFSDSFTKEISRKRFLCIDDVMEAFTELWGIAVAIMIFLIEFVQNAQYGIKLKRIVGLKFGKRFIWSLALFYLSLYPAAYLAHYFAYENSLFCIWLSMLIGLLGTLVYGVLLTEAETVRKTLKDHTLKTLSQINKKESGQSMENIIDGLPVTDMLLHMDYTNKEERDVISDIMVDILSDGKSFPTTLCKGKKVSLLQNVIFMNWIERISSRFNLEDKRQRETLTRFLNDLLDKMDFLPPEKKKCYTLQCMIALLKYNSGFANQILLQIWKRISEKKEVILVYLLLYTEFYYWSGDHEILGWLFLQDSELKMAFHNIRMGNVNYDYDSAIKFWISWLDYGNRKNEMGFNYFNSFMSTLDCFRGEVDSLKQEPCITLDYLK